MQSWDPIRMSLLFQSRLVLLLAYYNVELTEAVTSLWSSFLKMLLESAVFEQKKLHQALC